MHSIRIFLVASILATLVLFNFIAALSGYRSSMREAETLFDNQLLDMSRLIANLDFKNLDGEFRLGNNIVFQIWQNEELLASSSNAPENLLNSFTTGFDNKNFNGYRWRTYSRYEGLKSRWIIVAERSDLRFVLAENVVLSAVYPILAGIPLVGLLIWLVVSQGLKPLRELSHELSDKQATDLSPIHYENSHKELEQMIQATNGFISRLDAALSREMQFSADAAHELRTPISVLKIQLHNLHEDLLGGGSENDSFHQLEQGVERMQHLVEQLLTLYRTTPDQFNRDARELDLYEVVQDVIVQYYPHIEEKRQSLELLGESKIILGDRFALETMVSNLLSNASKYTDVGGKIIVRVENINSVVELSVEDNGSGINEKDEKRIFDRFYRSANVNDNAQVPGCGLGLTIVSHVAELHGATLSYGKSDFGVGSKFKVTFNNKR